MSRKSSRRVKLTNQSKTKQSKTKQSKVKQSKVRRNKGRKSVSKRKSRKVKRKYTSKRKMKKMLGGEDFNPESCTLSECKNRSHPCSMLESTQETCKRLINEAELQKRVV